MPRLLKGRVVGATNTTIRISPLQGNSFIDGHYRGNQFYIGQIVYYALDDNWNLLYVLDKEPIPIPKGD